MSMAAWEGHHAAGHGEPSDKLPEGKAGCVGECWGLQEVHFWDGGLPWGLSAVSFLHVVAGGSDFAAQILPPEGCLWAYSQPDGSCCTVACWGHNDASLRASALKTIMNGSQQWRHRAQILACCTLQLQHSR